jgi:DNA processing protein
VRGHLPEPGRPSLAIVGARAATKAGCDRAGALAARAARHGWAIVSGGALGIDAAAHRAALAVRAPTFAVLGCGVDVIYPDRHAGLYDAIAAAGGVITEYPPGTPPRGPHFPARNRLVSGLADLVLVVEAQLGSGALVTARLASRQGRRLLALGGSPGTEALLASGAAERIESEDDLASVLAGGVPASRRTPPAPLSPLLAALRRLPSRSAGPVELALALGKSLPDTLALVAEAELDGWIRRLPGGAFASLEEVSRAS